MSGREDGGIAMGVSRRVIRGYGAALVTALALVAFDAPSAAQTAPKTQAALAAIRIGNFGQISDTYYRGEQPTARDYPALAKLGVKTVIDLTKDGDRDEARLVEQAGMTFHRIPMTTTDRPADAAVAEFLKLVNDPANQPVYVHCQGGRHRTGVMTAVYRMTKDHWTADQAYKEMQKYKFEGFLDHPELRAFVYDYYKQLQAASSAATAR
jgi:tyrosine-protein phosphatase SIW14